MNQVKLLSEQVANQIAAGEVVERPASVVKELVENALDAQAERITVEILDGGRTLIRVSDDGVGMSYDDALMSLQRHATSKIHAAEDLSKIATMGFRGEAVPSIASVSRMTITTRERSENVIEGTEITISGGKILDVKAAGAPPGTSIEVRNLFFNLPARRKFLRSIETERSHIQNYIALVAMAYPHLAITYIQEGKTVFQFPPIPSKSAEEQNLNDLQERLRLLYGTGDALVEVNSEIRYDATPDDDAALGAPVQLFPIRLWGFIGAAGVSRSARDRQHFFVNHRPVDNRTLSFALTEAYQNALMKGRYPICCLFLEIDPSEVDVNIHPAKREIKFHKEQAVRRITARILRTALEDYSKAPQPQSAMAIPMVKNDVEENAPKLPLPQTPSDSMPTREGIPELQPAAGSYPIYPVTSLPKPVESVPVPLSFRSAAPANAQIYSTPLVPGIQSTAPQIPHPTLNTPLLKVPLRYIGVLGRLYILFESDRGLVLVDQHAAHERVLFERLMQQSAQNKTESQKLLLPETIELGIRDAATLRNRLSVFNHLGIGIHEFGERTFLIDALPPFVKNLSPKKFVLDLLDDLRCAGRDLSQTDMIESTIASHACRLAVKAHDTLATAEIERLMDDLRHCSMPYTCPHGRPTLIEITTRELEKKFGRIVP